MKQFILKNRTVLTLALVVLVLGALTMSFEDSPFMRIKFQDARLVTDTVPQHADNNIQVSPDKKTRGNMSEKNCRALVDDVCRALRKIDVNRIAMEIENSIKKVDLNRITTDVERSLKDIDSEKIREELRSSLKNIDWKVISLSVNEALKEVRTELQKAKKDLEKARVEMGKEPI